MLCISLSEVCYVRCMFYQRYIRVISEAYQFIYQRCIRVILHAPYMHLTCGQCALCHQRTRVRVCKPTKATGCARHVGSTLSTSCFFNSVRRGSCMQCRVKGMVRGGWRGRKRPGRLQSHPPLASWDPGPSYE